MKPSHLEQPRARLWTLRLGVVLFVVWLGWPGFSSPVQAQDDPLQDVRAAYRQPDFDRVIELSTELAGDASLDRATRRVAVQYLGRAYFAKNELEKARRAIEMVFDLEPPRIEPDPDIEPPPLIRLYYNARKERDSSYVVPPDSGRLTMAVVDLTNGSPHPWDVQYAAWQQGLSSMLINYLSGAVELKVVERERLQWLLDELDMQLDSRHVDRSQAVDVGRLLGAHLVLIGNYMVVDERFFLGARLVSVETGEVLNGKQLNGRVETFYELLQDLSLEVAALIDDMDLSDVSDIHLDRQTLGARTDTRSDDAMMAYSEGLVKLQQDDYQGAYDKFLEALTYDPNYQRARRKADSILPLAQMAALPPR